MPVKRRLDKRRLDDLRAWECFFLSGYDWFEHLDAGIVADRSDVPRELALAAWRRLGAVYLAQFDAEQAAAKHPHQDQPWALEEFGQPPRVRRYAG